MRRRRSAAVAGDGGGGCRGSVVIPCIMYVTAASSTVYPSNYIIKTEAHWPTQTRPNTLNTIIPLAVYCFYKRSGSSIGCGSAGCVNRLSLNAPACVSRPSPSRNLPLHTNNFRRYLNLFKALKSMFRNRSYFLISPAGTCAHTHF